MEAEMMERLNELRAMPLEGWLTWSVMIFGMPVAAWAGWVLGR